MTIEDFNDRLRNGVVKRCTRKSHKSYETERCGAPVMSRAEWVVE